MTKPAHTMCVLVALQLNHELTDTWPNSKFLSTVKLPFNEDLDITKQNFRPRLSYSTGNHLHLTNPRYNERISSVPWQFVKSRFHCTRAASVDDNAKWDT